MVVDTTYEVTREGNGVKIAFLKPSTDETESIAVSTPEAAAPVTAAEDAPVVEEAVAEKPASPATQFTNVSTSKQTDHIEVLLEAVRDAEVPHRKGEEVLVGRAEPFDRPLDLAPCRAPLRRWLPAVKDRVLRVERGAVEGGERLREDVERVDRVPGVGGQVGLKE